MNARPLIRLLLATTLASPAIAAPLDLTPSMEGDAYAVPEEVVERIRALAEGSWGRAYTWA